MANWQDTGVLILRNLLGDLSSTPEYSDIRLEQILVTSAHFINQEVDFDNDYTVSVEDISISPDPISVSDYSFINLMTLKSACILAGAAHRLASMKAMGIKDGPSSIDGKPLAEASKAWAESICSQYQKALLDFRMGRRVVGSAIIGPYTTSSIADSDPRDRNQYFS